MALDSDLVRVAVTGGVYVDLTSAGTLPTTLLGTIPVEFDEVGYLNEDGITQSIAQDVTDIQAWQNGDIVRRVQTSHDVTYQFSMLETNPVVLETYYGNYAAGVVEINGASLPRAQWVFDVFDGEAKIRLVIPKGQITERGDTQYVNGAALVYPVTITAYPDENGVKAYLYHDDDLSS
jgi:hypothetical protein